MTTIDELFKEILPTLNDHQERGAPIKGFGLNDFAILVTLANGRDTPCPFYLTPAVLKDYFSQEPTLPLEAKSMSEEVILKYVQNLKNFVGTGDARGNEVDFDISFRDNHIGMSMVCATHISRNIETYKSRDVNPYVFYDFLPFCKSSGSNNL